MKPHPGQVGYAENAEALVRQYESVPFEQVHAETYANFPAKPCRILDIGAGSGRDAAALAFPGDQVVAVEPTTELRNIRQSIGREGVTLTALVFEKC